MNRPRNPYEHAEEPYKVPVDSEFDTDVDEFGVSREESYDPDYGRQPRV